MMRSWLFFTSVLAFAVALWHLATGFHSLNWWFAVQSFFQGSESLDRLVLFDVRLPRTLLAAFCGAGLALAGSSMQGLVRHPFAEPSLLGVSSCAALASIAIIYYGLSGAAWFVLPLAGILGAFFSAFLLWRFTHKRRNAAHLLLVGVAINSLAGAGIALALNFSPNPYAMTEMVFWMLGSFANRSMQDVYLVFPLLLVGIIILLRSAPFYRALTLGDDTAKTMGFDYDAEVRWTLLGLALTVGACVAVCGNIGFVGFVVPQIVRPLVKNDPGKLLALSLPCGAVLVLFADLLVQLLPTQQELKVGVVTSLLAAPLLLLYWKKLS